MTQTTNHYEPIPNEGKGDMVKANRAERKKATKKAWRKRNKRKRSRTACWNEGR